MSDRLMRLGLVHEYGGINTERFLKLIDETGGWPLGYEYVGFEHSTERQAGFTNSPQNDGWWTVVYSSDDYYLWKLNHKAIQRIVDAAVSAIRLPAINASSVWIKNSRGHRADLRKEPTP